MQYVVPPPSTPKIPVILHQNDVDGHGSNDTTFDTIGTTTATRMNPDDPQCESTGTYYFPVRRIFCVGRNYKDHVVEMGEDPQRELPCFFMKPSHAIVPCGSTLQKVTTMVTGHTEQEKSNRDSSSIQPIVYPLATNDLHHEVELVIAIGPTTCDDAKNNHHVQVGFHHVSVTDAASIVYGYTIGIDLTRRDIQSVAKKNGLPWCTSKGFDQSAPIGHIYPICNPYIYHELHVPLTTARSETTTCTNSDHTIVDDGAKSTSSSSKKMWLQVNGIQRQMGLPIEQMIWSVPEIISILSHQFTLHAGDIIYTGTPAGVGPLRPGDHVRAGMDGLGELEFIVQPRE
jgi:fumarylpyruvate hydrolase